MPLYNVTIPIAGHAFLQVEADNEDAAIEAAFASDDLTIDAIGSWEPIEAFNAGNVCYCPHPWEAEAEEA